MQALIVGSAPTQRIEPNVLACFLAYHASLEQRGAGEFALRNIDDLDDELVWNEANYLELIAREARAAQRQQDFVDAPSGGLWVLKTCDGRII